MKRHLETLIDNAPPGHFPPKIKEKLPETKRVLLRWAELVDDLGRLDERSQKVYIDETSVRKLVREAVPGAEDDVIAVLAALPDSNLTRCGGGMKKIPWETVSERMAPAFTTPLSADAERDPTPYEKFEDIRAAVQRQF